jgi:hydrogenase maturation protein HypF
VAALDRRGPGYGGRQRLKQMNRPATINRGALERRRYRVRGLVQGVGFRPHVYRCATRLNVTGFVSNGPEGVLIEAEGERLDDFLQVLQDELPPLARVDSLIESALVPAGDTEFSIAPTESGVAAGAAIPADTALCEDCLAELFDPGNRRYLHPFIACCNCGPRYTMTRCLPYDRASTAMADFELCPDCEFEYTDPADRRFHAEPVACHHCGPRLCGDIDAVGRDLAAGRIVAIKGVGGYHLACDARNRDAVLRLRSSKQRDGKPFAVMVLNRSSAGRYIQAGAETIDLLESRERPVVIALATGGARELSPDLSHGLGSLGVMLPYTAVHYLLFHTLLGSPAGTEWLEESNELALVMTSANISGDPLITRRSEAEDKLATIADSFLHHDREISARADDSVVRTADSGAPMIIRRARGYAPHAIKLAGEGPQVLALGPHLKSTVTMTRGNRAYISPHVGDLDTPAAVSFHRETAEAMQNMLQSRPEVIACDLSRDFASTRLAEQLSEDLGLPLVRVQHHHAHVAAVMAEHRIEEPVLGMALDGHGQGTDGQSWGGELLRVQGATFERLGHLAPLPLPGGDRAAREPWRMAAGALHLLGRGEEIAGRFAEEPLATGLSQWLSGGEVGTTSAAGRLFDAVAGLLGVCPRASFEGEPPMLLEGLVNGPLAGTGSYRIDDGVLDFVPLLSRLADCDDPTLGANLFHGTLIEGLADWTQEAASRSGIRVVTLCGGCFLNAQLARELPPRLEAAGLKVLQARAMPPNDGAISLGQAWVAQRTH